MKLHLNKELFRDAILVTAQRMDLPPIYIEKDYWVTFALYKIFHSEVGRDTIFKGGTALSKCYKMIERFSEDIDLVVLRHEGETDNKLKSKLKAIGKLIEDELPEVEIEGITHKRGMIRKTTHTYNQLFKGNYGQVRDVIVLEATWLGYYEPYSKRNIISFVGEMMLSNSQNSIAEEYGLLPFEVEVLETTRTICEKIMSLVRFSYGETPIQDLKNKIRHTYDLHKLLSQKEFNEFFNSSAFDEMLIKVANDDVRSFKNNNQWLVHHPSESLIFNDTESVWGELKNTYTGDFCNLVYGELPEEQLVLETLKKIRTRLTDINWTVKIDN
ncbi:nucleotidyl transferase AbiEii/AbiGii toxin family protein [Parabacteroides sp. OttesenSCG-928-G07]|nr:nucleotidyl transferase AbiEii/AbiGii toxin family protein [Parabacteroides sp. OttesenSCG-928-G07]